VKTGYLSIFIVLVSASCRKTGNDSHNAVETFPNKVGDTWTYLVNDTTTVSGQTTSTVTSYDMTVSIVGRKGLAGGLHANVWVYSTPGRSDTCYVTQSGDTIQFSDIHEEGMHLFSRQYITPIALNESWPYVHPSIYNVQVASQSDLVVGSNLYQSTFHIYGYAGMPDGIFFIDEWFENNVGTVKRYYNSSGMALGFIHAISWSLVSYNIQ
jgi:hypothetical protein